MPKFNVPFKAGHNLSHSTDFNWLWLLPPTAHQPRQESQILSAGASRTRALTTGSPVLYQLSYGTLLRLGHTTGNGAPYQHLGAPTTTEEPYQHSGVQTRLGRHTTWGANCTFGSPISIGRKIKFVMWL